MPKEFAEKFNIKEFDRRPYYTKGIRIVYLHHIARDKDDFSVLLGTTVTRERKSGYTKFPILNTDWSPTEFGNEVMEFAKEYLPFILAKDPFGELNEDNILAVRKTKEYTSLQSIRNSRTANAKSGKNKKHF